MPNPQQTPIPKSSYQDVRHWVDIQRQSGVKICFTNGVYDILTAGHIKFLEWLNETLIPLAGKAEWAIVVGINSDESVQANKGRHRPVNRLEDRLAVMNGLWMPDLVAPFYEPTPIDLITAIMPDLLAKGGDYRNQKIVGQEIVEARNGRVLFGPYLEDRSTSKTIERVYRATHQCGACSGRGLVTVGVVSPFDPNDPHDNTCPICAGRGYV